MSDHEWCRDVQRDEEVRAAEDAAAVPAIQHRDLPEIVADLRERVARLEAAQATLGSGDEIARLIAERDAAKEECERLRAERDDALLVLPACCGRLSDAAATVIQERDHARSRVAELLKDCETYGRAVLALQGQCDLANDRVAELEGAAAPAANAGGYANNPHEPESLPEQLAYMMAGPFEKRVFVTREEVYAYRRSLSEIEAASMIFIPLYASPQPPRGWLTEEERAAVEEAMVDYASNVGDNECERIERVLRALLARSTPPKVKMPPASTGETPLVRDLMWGEAIRAAGGEVEG